MKKKWETVIILFAACGFWGMIYPDLCFTQDTCKAVYADEEKDIFTLICEADEEQIEVKSEFLDFFSENFRKKRE